MFFITAAVDAGAIVGSLFGGIFLMLLVVIIAVLVIRRDDNLSRRINGKPTPTF